jgi:hypothetical protein
MWRGHYSTSAPPPSVPLGTQQGALLPNVEAPRAEPGKTYLPRPTLRELRFWATPLDLCRCQAVMSRQAVESSAGDRIAFFTYSLLFPRIHIQDTHMSLHTAMQPGEAAAGAEHGPRSLRSLRSTYTVRPHVARRPASCETPAALSEFTA